MKFTPAIARYYLSRNRCARPLSGQRSLEIAELMRDGKFDASATFIDVDEADYLMGGQHVLSAITESGMTFELQVRKGMSYFPALILYTDKNEYVVVSAPDKIDSGREFKMIQTNIEIK
jgi:hypothetical protein